jgi:hypothetical protein
MASTSQRLSDSVVPAWERLLEQNSECATATIEITGKILGLSRAATYAAAHSGEIPTLRFGRRLSVPKAWLRQQLLGAAK